MKRVGRELSKSKNFEMLAVHKMRIQANSHILKGKLN